jgi:hypothetical protein
VQKFKSQVSYKWFSQGMDTNWFLFWMIAPLRSWFRSPPSQEASCLDMI